MNAHQAMESTESTETVTDFPDGRKAGSTIEDTPIDFLLSTRSEGGFEFAVFYITMLTLATIVGNVGNTMVIGAVLSDKKLRRATNIFIINLALADLCVNVFVEPFNLAGVFVNRQFWVRNDGLCHVIGSLCLVSCFCSLWSIAGISLNRYVLICHQAAYHDIFTVRNTILIALLFWLGGVLLDLPNFLGWGDHGYDMKTRACSYDRTASYSYTVFFIAVFLAIPLFTVLFCNAKIFRYFVQCKARVAAHSQGGGSSAAGIIACKSGVGKTSSVNTRSTDLAASSASPSGRFSSGANDPPSRAISPGTKTTLVVPIHIQQENSVSIQLESCPEAPVSGANSQAETRTEAKSLAPIDEHQPVTLSADRDFLPHLNHPGVHPIAQISGSHTPSGPGKKQTLSTPERKKKQRSETPDPTPAAARGLAPAVRQEIKLAKTLFIVFSVFCLCWAPYGVLCLVDRGDTVAKEAYLVAILMAHTSSSINSVIYAATNRQFRDGYRLFLRKCGFKCF